MADFHAARTRLVLDHPWLAALIFRLIPTQDESIATCATDGKRILYSRKFIAGLDTSALASVLAHESLHCGLLHHSRRGTRDPQRWNFAADYAVNILLADSGMPLPSGALLNKKFRGLTAEEIYDQLPQKLSGKADDLRDGDASGGDSEWKEAAAAAMHAAIRAGILPDGSARIFEESFRAKIDWREVLARYIIRAAGAEDYSYARPSRRGRALGIILPGMYREMCAPVAICIDSSGSMSSSEIGLAVSLIRSVLTDLPLVSCLIIESDAQVHRTTELLPGDDWVPQDIKGGGGTDFRPALAEAARHEPCCIIYISDMDGEFPKNEEFDTIWLTKSAKKAPIGRTIRMEDQ